MAYSPKNPNGQATMANSEPVVIASDQSTVPVSVSGVSTAANQTTIIGHLDGVEGLLTTIDADTGNISTKIDTIAGAVAGTEMQVDVLTMPTVTVTATNLDVQSGGADLATSTQAGAIQTAVELIDDTVATLGTTTYTEAATKGLIVGAVRRDADTTLVDTTNEVTPLQVDANGRLKVEAFSGETLPVSLTSTTITGTVAVTQSGTWDEVGINDSGNSITVDNGGTFAVQESGAALTALQIMDDWDNAASDGASVSGDVAHDSPDAGEPVKIGFKAIAHGTNPTAVGENDRTNWYANRHGIPWFIGGHPNIITKEFTFADADGAQTNVALVTVSAGTKIVVTKCTAVCDNDNTDDISVRIGFAGATLSAVSTSGVTGIVLSHPGIAAGSGIVEGTGTGIIGIGADGEDLRITCDDPVGGSLRIVVTYYTIES